MATVSIGSVLVLRLRLGGGVDGQGSILQVLELLPTSPSTGRVIGGVGFPELLDGEPSDHILSRSLSDSSPLLPLLLEGTVNEIANGLCILLSVKYVDFESNVGRRSRKKSGFGCPSSADVEDDTVDVDGSANSSEDVGKDKR